MLEKYIIEFCSPTLASIKSGNLFMYKHIGEDIEKNIEEINFVLKDTGVTVALLKNKNNKSLIYVYRRKKLEKELLDFKVANFLKQNGYENTNICYMINTLKSKLIESDLFPHEIGLFLGYPIEDVLGFIEHKGKKCKCNGCWKVYCNEQQAEILFAKYNKCKKIYKNLWEQGRSITQLTVAV
ncbi:MAG: DUF3793 family protein [Lachnospirales bacterium]